MSSPKPKRKRMSEVQEGILREPAKGADAHAAVMGAVTQLAPSSDAETEGVYYKVRPDQRRALVSEAVRRMEARGRGQPDASAVLREVLDKWLAAR